MNNYEFRLGCLDNGEISSLINLFKESFPKSTKFSKEYLIWQYKNNPIGNAVSFNAYDINNNLVAHYATIPIKMYINNKEEIGLLSLNTATHPNHQGKGLFKELANRTYEYAKNKGYAFVIGAANKNSTHGFLKNLGFYLIAPLDVKIGIGKIKTIKNPKYTVIWNQESIEWRVNNPSSKYYISRKNIYSDLIIGVKAVIKTMDSNIEIIGLSKKNKLFSPFNLYIGLGISDTIFYFNLPKFIKRSPFNLIFKDLNGNLPIVSRRDIKFELFDFDVI